MPIFQNHAGFCIARSKLQLIEIDFRKENFYLENVDEELFGEELDPLNRETKFISILQNTYNTLTIRKILNTRNVSFALHHDLFKVIEIPFDSTLTERDLIEHFNWELQLLFPSEIPDDYFIQYVDVDKSNLRKEKCAIVLAINRRLLNLINKFCVKNNLVLRLADNIHFATNVFITLDNQSVKNEIYLSVLIEEKDFSVIIMDEKNPIHFSVKQYSDNADLLTKMKSIIDKLGKYDLSVDNITKSYVFGNNAGDELIEKIKISPLLYENRYFVESNNSFAPAAGVALRLQ
jgi:hypothetical protein